MGSAFRSLRGHDEMCVGRRWGTLFPLVKIHISKSQAQRFYFKSECLTSFSHDSDVKH